MENNELQRIWKSMDSTFSQKSREELNLLLTSKTKQTINKFLGIIISSSIVSAGLIIWLIITSINRKTDMIYVLNNTTLGIITVLALFSGLYSWFKLRNYKFNQSLKSWLEVRIDFLLKSTSRMSGNYHIFLLIFLYVLTMLSIHVYFEYKPFVEVLKTEESLIGLIVATPIGLFVSFYVSGKIRKYQLKNLEFLKDLHHRLCNLS